jgi:hypothetical protein
MGQRRINARGARINGSAADRVEDELKPMKTSRGDEIQR